MTEQMARYYASNWGTGVAVWEYALKPEFRVKRFHQANWEPNRRTRAS